MMQFYFHYNELEEHHFGMWKRVSQERFADLLPKAIEFTGDHNLYGSWMVKALSAWPNSCKQNLTDFGINRRAFIGHAATCLALGCPEYITRLAWHYLSEEQQFLANEQADCAIRLFEKNLLNEYQLCLKFD